MRARRLNLVLVVLLVLPSFAQTPANPAGGARREDVVRFLQLIGSDKLMRQVLDQMLTAQLEAFHQGRPDIPADFWTEFGRQLREEMKPEDLTELVIPIYQRHFTADEMRQLVAFYETPLGRKVATELPEVQQEAMEAGGEWGQKMGQRIGREVAQRMREKGYRTDTPPRQ